MVRGNMDNIDFKKIKCLILDIDNTLTNTKREITDYTREIISKIVKKGIYVILCTGRTNQYAIKSSKYCNGSPIVIVDNGALIYNYALNKVYFCMAIPKAISKKIFEICLANEVDCVFNAINARYRCKETMNRFLSNIETIDSLDDINEIVTQIVVSSEEENRVQTCYDLIKNIKEVEINNTSLGINVKRDYAFLDVNTPGISKGLAIQKLMDILNLTNEEIMCFGDSINDISMFEVCKYSVALKNAEDSLKNKAYMITEYDNDNDGLAKFLNKYFLED